MNRFIFTLSLFALFVFSANAQLHIDNQCFEDWTDHQDYVEFPPYNSSNSTAKLNYGAPNVTAVASHNGSTAIRLETVGSASNPQSAFISLGKLCGSDWQDHIPYTDSPDSLVAWVRYDISASNTEALFFILFKHTDGSETTRVFPVNGANNSFQRYSVPIFVPAMAWDSIAFAITSGNTFGDWLEVDDMQLVGSTQQLPNSDFETTDTLAWQTPDGWAVPNETYTYFGGKSPATQSTDAYSGSYALRLETVEIDVNCTKGIYNPLMTDGEWVDNEFEASGQPWNPTEESFTYNGWYKYSPLGDDTALVAIIFTKYNTLTQNRDTLEANIGFAILPATNTYTQFSIPIDTSTWAIQPDSFELLFVSSDIFGIVSQGAATAGSVLLLDELGFSSSPNSCFATAIEVPILALEFKLYPNPAQDQIQLDFDLEAGDAVIEILDLQGKQLLRQAIYRNQSSAKVNISSLAKGIYLVKLSSRKGSVAKKLVVR